MHPHLARERALKVLFAADVRGVDPRILLDTIETQRGALELLDELEPDEDQVESDEELQLELTRRRRLPLDGYTRDLVAGVASRRRSIDDLLGETASGWTVRRMPAVDRNLLRLAVYELVEQDTPHAVVIDEAVSLAGGFAGEKARGFVNGVLETIRRQVVAGEVTLVEAVDVSPAPVADEAADGADEHDETAADHDHREEEVEVDEAAQGAYTLALDLLEDDDATADSFVTDEYLEVGELDPVDEDAEDDGPVEDREDEAQDDVAASARAVDADATRPQRAQPLADEDDVLW